MADSIDLTAAQSQFVEFLQARKRARATIVAYRKDIDQLISFLKDSEKKSIPEITRDDLMAQVRPIVAKLLDVEPELITEKATFVGDLKAEEGIGSGFVPKICRLDLADEIIAVKDEDAIDTARKLARTEGIFGGTTSGANVWAAIQRARIIGPGKKIVTVIVDSGLKYLNGALYK